ncbi:MAG: copper chaperone PCu(A)C [Gemmatimonadaceae bacterium]|jgi:copper(I)-binding protein|nr:copper chaperone PCu(A)C [Gemmatimonadaceae bacterium]
MHTALVAGVLAFALASAPVPASRDGELFLRDAWMLPASAGSDAKLFLHFENQSDQSLTVVRATSELARAVQGTDLAADGPSRSLYSSGFVVAAHQRLQMRPDGPHLVVSGLVRDLRAGDRFPLVLHCPDGLTLTVTVVVRPSRG